MAGSGPQLLEDDFEFILCEGCRQESPNLKLLTCLHTFCLSCLSKNKLIGRCPICQTAILQANSIPDMDNLLFTNLQARLKVYKKIVDGVDLVCDNCKTVGEFWCSKCEGFLCTKCFETHWYYLKREGHEAERVVDITAGSAKDFLKGTRKTSNLSCFNPTHKSQTASTYCGKKPFPAPCLSFPSHETPQLPFGEGGITPSTNKDYVSSIYCRKCRRALCCSCALLDGHHELFCAIGSETQRRQQELGTISQELGQQRSGFEATYTALQDEAARLEREQREMRELIQQRVEELVRLIRREEEELLRLVETRQEQGRRELEKELRHVEGVLRRMEVGERLAEKMSLYATDQEVMDMQPFIKDSLEQLQQLQPAGAGERAQPGDLAECRARLQALVERVTGHPGTSASRDDSLSEEDSTLILDLEPPRKHGQQQGDLLPPDQGGDMSPTQLTSPALLMQRDEEAEDNVASGCGNTVPLSRSIQDSLASLQENFGSWAKSNVQQLDELLEISSGLLQAQHRAGRHLVSMTQEIQAMSRSLATIASAVGPLLQRVAIPQDPTTAEEDWPSLPSDLLELFSPRIPQNHEPPVPATSTAPFPSRSPPATPHASLGCSEPPSPASEGECPRSRHPTRGKRGGKPNPGLQKRRKK